MGCGLMETSWGHRWGPILMDLVRELVGRERGRAEHLESASGHASRTLLRRKSKESASFLQLFEELSHNRAS